MENNNNDGIKDNIILFEEDTENKKLLLPINLLSNIITFHIILSLENWKGTLFGTRANHVDVFLKNENIKRSLDTCKWYIDFNGNLGNEIQFKEADFVINILCEKDLYYIRIKRR